MNKKPILILGSHRSGTQLVSRIIGSCRDVFLVTEHEEKSTVPEDQSPVDDSIIWWNHFDFSHPGIPPNYPPLVEEVRIHDQSAVAAVRKTYTDMAGDRRLVIKNPQHLIRVPLLREMFPDALYVYCVRNPWPVMQSMNWKYWNYPLSKRFSLVRMLKRRKRARIGRRRHYPAFVLRTRENFFLPNDLLLKSAHSWATAVDVYFKEKDDEWATIRYEELIEDPLTLTRSLFDQLGLDDEAGFERGTALIRDVPRKYDLIKKKYAANWRKKRITNLLEPGCRYFSYPVDPYAL